MSKKRLVIVSGTVVIVVLIAIFVSASLRSGPESTVLQSEDGQLELSIPSDALPEGVVMADIRIQKTDEAGILTELGLGSAPEEEEPSTMVAYRLLPDGLSLNKPITVTLTGETAAGGVIPMLFHWFDGNFELVLDTEVVIDLETNQTSISGEIGHFSVIGSDFYGKDSGMFNYELTAGGQGRVGDRFPYNLTITPTQEFTWFLHRPHFDDHSEYDYRMAPGTNWEVGYFVVMTRRDGVIEPMGLPSARTELGGFDSFTLEGTHTCIEEGTNGLILPPPDGHIDIDYRMEKEQRLQGGGTRKVYRDASTKLYIQGGGFTCDEEQVLEWDYMGKWDYDYVTLASMDKEEIAALGATLSIPSLAIVIDGTNLIFPFPETQFTLRGAHSGIEETGGDAYCASKHYHGEVGRSIQDPEVQMPEPFDEYGAHCGWIFLEGSLHVNPSAIIAWLEVYGEGN